MKNFINNLSTRIESLSTKQLLMITGAALFIAILILSIIFAYTAIAKKNKKPIKPKEHISKPIASTAIETKVDEKPKMTLEEVRELNKKIMSEDTQIDEYASIMSSVANDKNNANTGELTQTQYIRIPVQEAEKTSAQTKSEVKNPIPNPYNISKREDLDILMRSIEEWNKTELEELERAKKKAKSGK